VADELALLGEEPDDPSLLELDMPLDIEKPDDDERPAVLGAAVELATPPVLLIAIEAADDDERAPELLFAADELAPLLGVEEPDEPLPLLELDMPLGVAEADGLALTLIDPVELIAALLGVEDEPDEPLPLLELDIPLGIADTDGLALTLIDPVELIAALLGVEDEPDEPLPLLELGIPLAVEELL
jgi:hypothetical protein